VSETTTGVASQFAAVGFEKFGEILAADLLFAFDERTSNHRAGRSGFKIGFNRLEMRKVLALLSRRAAGEERTARRRGSNGGDFQQVEADPAAGRRSGRKHEMRTRMVFRFPLFPLSAFLSRVLATTMGWPAVGQILASRPI